MLQNCNYTQNKSSKQTELVNSIRNVQTKLVKPQLHFPHIMKNLNTLPGFVGAVSPIAPPDTDGCATAGGLDIQLASGVGTGACAG